MAQWPGGHVTCSFLWSRSARLWLRVRACPHSLLGEKGQARIWRLTLWPAPLGALLEAGCTQ